MLVISMAGLAACGISSSSANDSGERSTDSSIEGTSDVTIVSEEDNVDFEQMEEDASIVFALVLTPEKQSDEIAGIALSKCTPSFINALKRENEYDDGGVAWWALRTMEQDGPEDDSEVISIIPDGTNAVIVNYSDMGYRAFTRLEFVKDNGEYKINSATVSYNGEERTIN